MRATAPVAVVTGAGSGIGRSVARTLLDAGFRTALLGRRVSTLRETADPGRDGALLLAADVTEQHQVERAFEAVVERWGRVDLLFNNAGRFGPARAVDEVSPRHWNEVIEVNVTGAFLCARTAFGVMKRQRPRGGRIINNGSLSAHVPRPHAAAYTASKHALTGLTRALALEGRDFDIACGQIDVGNASTSMTDEMAAGILQADGAVRPEPRIDAQHVADAVLLMGRMPPSVNVLNLTLLATAMPYVGRG
jgi:NAD(P)-dependent dehydrogenase (short-subunit alcohol dehydrogenase family)